MGRKKKEPEFTEKQFLADMLEGIEDDDIYSYVVKHRWFFKKHESEYRHYFLNNPFWALSWAEEVQECACEMTRTVACYDSYTALLYASEVDEGPHTETREAACRDPEDAFFYAKNVDRGFHRMTFRAVLDGLYFLAFDYMNEVPNAKQPVMTILQMHKDIFE